MADTNSKLIFDMLNVYITGANCGKNDVDDISTNLHKKIVSVDAKLGLEIYNWCLERKTNCYVMNILGILYEYGIGVTKDEGMAKDNYKSSGDLGCTDALLNLAQYEENSDIIEAGILYNRAIKLGSIKGIYMLGHLYNDINKEKALTLFLESANLDYLSSMVECGKFYHKEKNIEKALYWFEKAANLECRISMSSCGQIYLEENNFEKAFYWYEKAANLGCPVSMVWCADISNKQKNIEKMIYWYEKAIDLNNPIAMWDLALYYENNFPIKAAELYYKAYITYTDDKDKKDCLEQIESLDCNIEILAELAAHKELNKLLELDNKKLKEEMENIKIQSNWVHV